MGKCCVRFQRADELALEVIGELVARLPARKFVAGYVAARDAQEKRGPKPRAEIRAEAASRAAAKKAAKNTQERAPRATKKVTRKSSRAARYPVRCPCNPSGPSSRHGPPASGPADRCGAPLRRVRATKAFLFDKDTTDVASFGALPKSVWLAPGLVEHVCVVGPVFRLGSRSRAACSSGST